MNNTRRSMIYLREYDGRGRERLTSLSCVIAPQGRPVRFSVSGWYALSIHPEGSINIDAPIKGTSWTEDSTS